MGSSPPAAVAAALVTLAAVVACSSDGRAHAPTNPQDGPPAGYADGHAPIPPEAQAEDASSPTTVIGTGTAASCTGEAFGAAVAKGGSLKVVNSRFFNNVCDDLGSDVGGGAIRKLDYLVAPGASARRPVWIVGSTFGGKAGLGNSCANGSAIYNDGDEIALDVTSSLIEDDAANEGGSAIFFVSNDRTGSITIRDSITRNNPRGTFETPGLPGSYVIARAPAQIIGSQILR
jgi:hypothetical protein